MSVYATAGSVAAEMTGGGAANLEYPSDNALSSGLANDSSPSTTAVVVEMLRSR